MEVRRRQSCSFWPEILDETKQNEEEYFCGEESQFRYSISQEVFAHKFP
jgi:hypothetical protein